MVEFQLGTALNAGANVWQIGSLALSGVTRLCPDAIIRTWRICENYETWKRKNDDGTDYVWDPIPRGVQTTAASSSSAPPKASSHSTASSSQASGREVRHSTQDSKSLVELVNAPSLMVEIWADVVRRKVDAEQNEWKKHAKYDYKKNLAQVAEDPK